MTDQPTVNDAIHLAACAGATAARARIAELRRADPTWTVHCGDSADPMTDGNQIGVLYDLCGGAVIVIDDARSAAFRRFRHAATITASAYAPRWDLARDDNRGRYLLSLYGMTRRPEVSVNRAAMQAALDALAEHGIVGHVETYID